MKKIKNITLRNIAGLLMLIMAMSSCSNFLDEDPHSSKTDKWTSRSDAEIAVNDLYNSGCR